jgi:serine/threonine protein kinase
MARRGPPWELPDLLDYRAMLVRAIREGPRALTELNLKTMWDYRPTTALMNFLSSDPNVGDDQDWQMVRPLGEGGFGHVGLWQVVRDDGSVADEIAIKQGHRLPGYDFDSNDHRGLAKEAVLQHQVNGKNCQNVVHLRRFKFYRGEQKYRFFMEYCPYGDLRRLRIRYRAKASRIPELFLWHLFHSLAQAISAMQGPWSHFITGEAYPKDYHMLHMDLKHDNVFLGYERPSNETRGEPILVNNYPTIKVGDFGLAVITGAEDADNPSALWATGTPDYMPPVSST